MKKIITIPGFETSTNLNMKEVLMKGELFNYGTVQNSSTQAEMHIYGNIGQFEDVDYNAFQERFRKLLSTNKEINLRIHSAGGDFMEGLAVYDLLRSSECKVHVIVEGLAAQMAGIIAMAGDTITMTESAYFMMRSVQAVVTGNTADFEAALDHITGTENRLKAIYESQTKASTGTINEWFDNSKENWLNAEQCLELGICHSIIKPKVNRDKNPSNGIMTNKAGNQEVTLNTLTNGRQSWTFADWQDNDPEGLTKLCFQQPEDFEKLFNARFAKPKEHFTKEEVEELYNKRADWTFSDWQEKDHKGLTALYDHCPSILKSISNTK